MPRTQRRLDGDLGYADGHFFIPISVGNVTGAGAVQQTTAYNGISNLSFVSLPTAATAYVATFPLGSVLFRYGLQDDIQEQFGAGASGVAFGANALNQAAAVTCTTTAGPASSITTLTVTPNTAGLTAGSIIQIDTGANIEFQVINTVASATTITVLELNKAHTANYTIIQNPFTTPAGVTGAPPFTGVTQLSPVTAPRPKGIALKTIYPVYSVANGVAALTVNTIGIIATPFLNAAALTQDTVLTAAANGLQTAANAASQFYVTPIAIPAAKSVFQTSRFKEFVFTWSLTTGAATGTAAIVGIFVDVTYNYT